MTLKALFATITLALSSQIASASYYCSINSSFDGAFGGGGWTKLEAEMNAKQACKVGSRQNGFYCQERSLTCESSESQYPSKRFYCSINSGFDGAFGGGGWTKLEAEMNAKQACKVGSRQNGFYCQERSLTCENSEGNSGTGASQYRSKQYYCSINSSFDGAFGGGGWTKLEAEMNAKQACKVGSRQNGFYCQERSLTCETAESSSGSGIPQYPVKHFYCTINSSFDGAFGGGGLTELEAKINAKQACKVGSRNEGFFCKENSLNCVSSN